ncbi:glycoside hydrolase family 5 protein [Athelia psychrophila]|uniref:cellulase n=1 Tax=Athelia psychrophila TaxID=1759441 RepID=A0A166TZK3_9AGAM|nr:glycoside hydrolase family 5 protein [Fibularhizoctonia sp. CBS 109695]
MKSLSLSLVIIATAASVRAQVSIYGQCGGIGYSGSTTCATGSVCTYSSAYYSQCLPGTATVKPTSSTGTASSSSASASSTISSIGPLGGVNTAGYDFTVTTDGSFTGVGVSPPPAQYQHFASEGVNIFRIPFAWQLMTPTLGGTINATFLAIYDKTVQAALSASTKPYVILDLHNYARWNGAIIGQGGPTNAQFASIWSQLATKYASTPKIIFGIMNEPHDIPSLPLWAASVQAAINAIRAAGATSQTLLLPGSSYASAQTLPTEAGPYLAALTDPAGGTSKLLFDVHKYLDSDNSGTHADCVTDNVAVLTTLVAWLKSVGNRQALLSETGGGSTSSCETYLNSELAYVKANSQYIVGFSVWAAGAFDTTYVLTVTPNADGTDQPIWKDAVIPNLP